MNTLKLFGPPGTGKTHALLTIMENELAAGVRPDRLAYLTFTVAARREATTRATTRFNLSKEDLPYFKTLHAVAYKALGVGQASLLRGGEEYDELERYLGMKFSRRYARHEDSPYELFGKEHGDRLMAFDHFRRHSMVSAEEAYKRWHEDLSWFEVERFTRLYAQWKENQSLLDFTDLLEQADTALPVDVMIVDEAQDLSVLQWHVLSKLAANAQRLYIAGDDDQAIFTWAGASPEAFLAVPGLTRVLGQSYRLPRRVAKVAVELAAGIRVRQQKVWKPRDEDGEVKYLPDLFGAELPAVGSVMYLYRHHYQGDVIEAELQQLGEPYRAGDRDAPGSQWGPAIVYWERLRQGKSITTREAVQVYDAMTAGHGYKRGEKAGLEHARGEVDMQALFKHHGLLQRGPWFEALGKLKASEVQYIRAMLRRGGNPALLQPPRVRLSTIHAAKGEEADHVILLTGVSRKVRETMDRDPDSERRVFYVGVSRARSTLQIVGQENPLF